MPKEKIAKPVLSNDEIRMIMLRYFYERNQNATSRRGKRTGAATPISIIRAELKDLHGLTIQQVQSNLTYLLSQGWVEDQPISKNVPTRGGMTVPSTTSYFIITAAGIDKIGGPSEFSRNRFEGIKIETTGQNIITLGDGNQVNVQYQQIGENLAKLRKAIKISDKLTEDQKIDAVADIDSLQDQLAKSKPNGLVAKNLWENINKAASIAGLTDIAIKIGQFIASFC